MKNKEISYEYLFKCRDCNKIFDKHLRLREHVLFYHNIYMPECETNKKSIREIEKAIRMSKKTKFLRTPPLYRVCYYFTSFWDRVENTDVRVANKRYYERMYKRERYIPKDPQKKKIFRGVWCKKCYDRKYYFNHISEIKRYKKEYYRKNREKILKKWHERWKLKRSNHS